MLLKKLTICSGRSRNISADQPGHDFAKNSSVILRLRISGRVLNAELLKGFAQPSERAAVERAC